MGNTNSSTIYLPPHSQAVQQKQYGVPGGRMENHSFELELKFLDVVK